MNKDLKAQIEARLKQIGMSHKVLAENIGMTEENLSRIFNDKITITEPVLQKISRVINRELIINGKE